MSREGGGAASVAGVPKVAAPHVSLEGDVEICAGQGALSSISSFLRGPGGGGAAALPSGDGPDTDGESVSETLVGGSGLPDPEPATRSRLDS